MSLSRRGYSIVKADMTPKELDKIRKDLIVSPTNFMINKRTFFSLYLESKNKIYVPKYYGILNFGLPSVNKIPEGFPLDPNIKFLGELRKEQHEPVRCLLNACHNPLQMGGILNVFCGGGKTTMALYALVKLGTKALIVVHKNFLLEQWKERILEFIPDARIGLIKGKICDIEDKDIVIASLQSLSMKDYDESLFESFGTVIIDEVHHTSAEVFSKALAKTSFMYTIGLSATVNRKDGLSKVFIWYLGDIVFKLDKRTDCVYVKGVDFKEEDSIVEYNCECHSFNNKLNIPKMVNNVCGYTKRNIVIVDIIIDTFKNEPLRKMLILSDRRKHLELLYNMIAQNNITTGLYLGGMKQEILNECSKKQVILATYAIASEGYDQKGLDTLILASPRTDVIQSVGRILRDKPEDRKHTPLVIDIIDNFSIFITQAKKRKQYYKKCGWIIS